MTFGLAKCAVVHMSQRKIVNLPTVEGIPILENEDNYKYLGLLQTNKVLHDASKDLAKKEF